MAEATVGLLRVALASNSAQFDASMDKSAAKVEAFGQAGRRAAQSLGRMVADFNGTKIIADANRMAEAIHKVEGVSKLTDAELRRVNSTLDQAVAKYRQLGQEVPPHIAKVHAEVATLVNASHTAATGVTTLGKASGATASGGLSQLTGALGNISRILPALGIASVIGSMVRLGTAAIEDAGALLDMSNATGLSTDTLQEMRAVANQTGTTLEAFTGTAFKLGVNIATGTAKARDAVRDLNLEYTALKAASPDEQFRMTITALEGVTDAQERNRIGTALFGKQFKEIAAGIEDGYGRIADAAGKSSRAQLEALDRAGDKWAAFKTEFQRSYQGMLGTFVQGIEDIERAADSLSVGQKLSLFMRGGGGGGVYLNELKAQGQALRETSEEAARAAKFWAQEADTAQGGLEDYTETLRAAKAEVAGLSDVHRTQLTAALALGGDAAQAYADSIGLSDTALRLYSGSAKTGATASTELADAQKGLFGADTIGRANLLVAALGDIGNVSKLTTDKKADLRAAVEAALEAYQALGQAAPANLTRVLGATLPLLEVTRNLGAAVKTAGGMVFPMPKGVADSSAQIGEIRESMEAMGDISFNETWTPFIKGVNASEAGTKRLVKGADDLAEKWKTIGAQVSGIIVGSAMGGGDMLKSLGSFGGQKLGEFAGEKIAKAIGGKLGATLGGMAGPIGAALGTLAGAAIGKLFGGASKEVLEARKQVDAFEASIGKTLTVSQKAEAGNTKWKMTVIAVRDAYLATGRTAAEADAIVKQLWNTDKPKAAAAAMEEINRVLEEQGRILEENQSAANTLFDDIMSAGSEGIPAAYRPAIEQLISLGLLTDEQAAKLRGLGDLTGVSVSKMTDAMELFKGRIESLGPAYRQAKLDETSKKYVNAMDALIKGGADVGGVLFDAREEFGALVSEAIRGGQTLPANMKPWIDDLFNAGNLLDENGQKISDISGLKYGEAQKTEAEIAEEGWNKILAAIQELIDKINGPLNQAIRNIPDKTVKIGADTGDLDRALNRDDYRVPDFDNAPSFAVGTKGMLGDWFGKFNTRGTRAVLHDREAVITPRQAVPFALDTLSGLIPDVPSIPSLSPAFAGPVGAVAGDTTTNETMVFVGIPVEAAGDVYRITREVVKALPPAIKMNEGKVRDGIERVIEDYNRTYSRG